jgi:hypothetical protein
LKSDKRPHHRIEVFVDRIEQLFNSMDPSPFHKRDFDDDAEEFIVSSAQEFPRRDPVSLVIHVSQLPAQRDAQRLFETAVHHYFAYRAKLKKLELRHLLKEGRTSLLIGLLFLGTCLLTSELLRRQEPKSLSMIASQGLMIAGWVAMWRPMELFLYKWWPLLRKSRLYQPSVPEAEPNARGSAQTRIARAWHPRTSAAEHQSNSLDSRLAPNYANYHYSTMKARLLLSLLLAGVIASCSTTTTSTEQTALPKTPPQPTAPLRPAHN